MRRRPLVVAATVALAGAAVAAGLLLTRAPGPPDGPGAVNVRGAGADISYVIPAGTGARLDRGVKISLLPARIEARVGQVISIVNRDDRGYLLGPFYVGARETLTQRFTSAGVFKGVCVVHPSGTLELVVTG